MSCADDILAWSPLAEFAKLLEVDTMQRDTSYICSYEFGRIFSKVPCCAKLLHQLRRVGCHGRAPTDCNSWNEGRL